MTTSIYQGGNFYVYLITDLNPVGEARYYIGSRTATHLQENNVNPENDPYMGSSHHSDMIQGLKERPDDFEKIIIETFDDSKECLIVEEYYQRQHHSTENTSFFNMSYANHKYKCNTQAALKGADTKRNDIDKYGLNGHQRVTLKRSVTVSDPKWKDTVGRKQHINARITNGCRWKAIGHTEYGAFDFARELSDAMNDIIPPTTIYRHAVSNFSNIISRKSLSRSKYLQSLPYNPIGMTWAETGFFVIEHDY